MSTNNEAKVSLFSLEVTKWVVILTSLLTAILFNYYCKKITLYLRMIAIITLVIISICILFSTKTGKNFSAFIRESKAEIKKVTWPTYQETFRITLIVIAVTILMSLILWGLDNILVRLVSFVTTLRL
ncbi:preprotein translocase subunit SecE [Candidatus Pantoea edessiphila]|uniref:Protein translocase subunit SecE n=1 Tax=Candidatus Pantoea edessiphila TaxID=2044610 RepID=A0A2P5T135_9GAMM|nr:preprotein translocase subunit SecE [Candidatus Pantoea edessiphila]PPI88297.1 preprotein translocase subunit SecE [Candidatus Pantoea edessiphila]